MYEFGEEKRNFVNYYLFTNQLRGICGVIFANDLIKRIALDLISMVRLIF